MLRCGCGNIQHKSRCMRPVVWRCKTCQTTLCQGCSKKHHVHFDLELVAIQRPTK